MGKVFYLSVEKAARVIPKDEGFAEPISRSMTSGKQLRGVPRWT